MSSLCRDSRAQGKYAFSRPGDARARMHVNIRFPLSFPFFPLFLPFATCFHSSSRALLQGLNFPGFKVPRCSPRRSKLSLCFETSHNQLASSLRSIRGAVRRLRQIYERPIALITARRPPWTPVPTPSRTARTSGRPLTQPAASRAMRRTSAWERKPTCSAAARRPASRPADPPASR